MADNDDLQEVQDLEAAAEWRMRQVDANPADRRSAEAAQHLVALAEDLRGLTGSPLFAEYRGLCGWLDEFEGAEDFQLLALEYRRRIGVADHPADGEAYLRALIALAKQAAGTL